VANSNGSKAAARDKRQRLTAAAAEVLHRQGVERTTIADIAQLADVPVGNVYYYFKTKDDLVRAALSAHADHLSLMLAHLDRDPDPRARLGALVASWVERRDITARYGCPTGTLAVELDKREPDGIDTEVGQLFRTLVDWVAEQFRRLGQPDPHDLAITFVAANQGMSLLSNALRDPTIMIREGERLRRWLDDLPT
jgi:AcrR family transcriptional regulator